MKKIAPDEFNIPKTVGIYSCPYSFMNENGLSRDDVYKPLNFMFRFAIARGYTNFLIDGVNTSEYLVDDILSNERTTLTYCWNEYDRLAAETVEPPDYGLLKLVHEDTDYLVEFGCDDLMAMYDWYLKKCHFLIIISGSFNAVPLRCFAYEQQDGIYYNFIDKTFRDFHSGAVITFQNLPRL